LNAQQEKQLRTIQTSARHLLSLINDLLDLARIEAGRVDLDLQPVDGGSALHEVAAALRPTAELKGLQLEVLVPSEPVVVRVDRRALNQILLNLAANAVKFTEQGWVRLELMRRRENGSARVEFGVADTGIGIDRAEQACLFDAFVQLDTEARRRGEGTGLGLHVSQKLARLLGGRITLESEWGSGSRFTLVLPAPANSADPSKPAGTAEKNDQPER
jgi:protein-histidine pros-kinase